MTPPARPLPFSFTDDEMFRLAGYVADALDGNGVGHKLASIQDTVQRMEKLVAKHEETLFGDDEKEGLVNQVRRVLALNSALSKVLWLAAGVIVTFLVSFLIYMIITHPLPY